MYCISTLCQVFNRPYEVYNNGNPGGSGVDSILLGQVSQRAETSDHFFARQVTKHLFSEGPPHRPGTDLPALNIQRGRDHGLPGKEHNSLYTQTTSIHVIVDIVEQISGKIVGLTIKASKLPKLYI